MAKRCHLIMWKNIVLVERENNSRITHLGNNAKFPNTACLYSLLFLSYLIVFRSLESVRRLGHVSFLQICFHDYGLRREEIKSGDL